MSTRPWASRPENEDSRPILPVYSRPPRPSTVDVTRSAAGILAEEGIALYTVRVMREGILRKPREPRVVAMNTAQTQLLTILGEVRSLLKRPGNDFLWSGWADGDEADSEIERHVHQIEHGDFSSLPSIVALFAPTGSIQEGSISNGWGGEFLDLAARFDKALERVKK